MDSTPQFVEPSRELISSERVRLLTSWKLWVPMLFLTLLLMAASILWPAYRRMRALELIEASGGGYDLGEARWEWMAEQLGPLGVGYQSVEAFSLNRPISLVELESLLVLSEVEYLHLVTTRVTPDWIEALGGFSRLRSLDIKGEITTDDVQRLLESAPSLEVLEFGRVSDGDRIAFEELSQGGVSLRHLIIEECKPSLTIAGFPRLELVEIDSMEDANLNVRDLPMLLEISFQSANAETTLTHDFTLPRLSYGMADAGELIIPANVHNLVIYEITQSTITGGKDLETLTIYSSADVTIESLPTLTRFECDRNSAALTLRDLPQLEHLVLMTREDNSRPTVVLAGVDNLRAIDAPWWRPNWTTGDPALLQIVELPRLEHLVIPRATLAPECLPLLQQMETLRFLRLPRQLLTQVAEGRNEWQETDYEWLRREFPQPGIRIHGPPRVSEQDDRWSPLP